MSTLHHQPLWLSLRNTNQQSAPNSLALSLFFLCYLTLSFSLSFSVCSLLLTENKCCITILILAWASRFCLVFIFFCLLEMHGASSGGAAQSKGSGVWILMTSTRRKWEEDVWGESFLNLLFSPSACLSHLWTHAHSSCVFMGFVSLWFWLISCQWTTKDLNSVVLKRAETEKRESCCCSVSHMTLPLLHSRVIFGSFTYW